MSQAHPAPPRFESVAAFMDWAERQDGKWELHDGIPIAMSPERADHARIKYNACRALKDGLRISAPYCEAIIDGLMVPGPGLRRVR
jgi:Uma2 family endonuclease